MTSCNFSGIRLCRFLGCLLVALCLLSGIARADGDVDVQVEPVPDSWDGMYWRARANIHAEHNGAPGDYIIAKFRFKLNDSSEWSSDWASAYYLLESGSDHNAELDHLMDYGADSEEYDTPGVIYLWYSDSTTSIPWEWAPGDTIEVHVTLYEFDGTPVYDTDWDSLIIPGAP